MEGLLPVIIALLISAMFGMRKKKSPVERTPPPVAESPWDDLLRDLQNQDKPQREYAGPDPEDDEIPQTTQPYFTYEQIEEPEIVQPVSFENRLPVIEAAPLQEVPAANGIDLATPVQGVSSSSNGDEESGGTLFEQGFDPRMAVLYSEVFRPKYQD